MMKRASRKNDMQKILNDYIEFDGGGPVDPDEVFAWAKRKGRWEPEPKTLRQRFREEFRRAASEEMYTDPQGRTVRRKHAVTIKEAGRQLVLWADIESAPPDHMRVALQQRRKGIHGDVKQLKTDQDSYNDNNKHNAVIQMSFNFDEDLEEGELPDEYPEGPGDSE